jgi:putative N6-adenine-specific DNA methylase
MSQGPPNLARRIKRRAWAPEWAWFATCAPGLEPLAAAELAGLGLEPSPRAGGVEFSGRLEAGYRANLWLRTAGRVLLRLADFRVRGWEDLERQAEAAPWEVFLPPGCGLGVRVSLAGSNLGHSGRVEEVVRRAAEKSLAGLGLAPPTPAAPGAAEQLILVRGAGRRCSISLDSSGGHLHQRGWRRRPGPAPLREDLAAALLLLAGYDGGGPLLEAMCGAGTLAIEAARLARGLPAWAGRPLAMLAWPCHREPTWRHLLDRAAEEARERAPAAILGRDLSARALDAARRNAAQAGVEGDVAWERADFLSAPPPEGPGWVVFNPPYGRRLGSVRQAGGLVARAGRRLARAYPGWRAAAVLYRPEWLPALGLAQARTLAAPFGGLKVTLAAGLVPPAPE